MVFNSTLICGANLLPEEVLKNANTYVAMPALFLLFTVIAIISLLCIFFFHSSEAKKKYFGAWITTIILSGVFLLFIVNSPNIVQEVKQFIKDTLSLNYILPLCINNIYKHHKIIN